MPKKRTLKRDAKGRILPADVETPAPKKAKKQTKQVVGPPARRSRVGGVPI